jgi:hypothetical protein
LRHSHSHGGTLFAHHKKTWAFRFPTTPFYSDGVRLEYTSPERPRDILSAACAEIAESFGPAGFRYLRSKRKIVRREGDLRFEIVFATSRRNYAVRPDAHEATTEALREYSRKHNLTITEESVEQMLQGSVRLSLRAHVYSARLQTWRSSQPGPLRTDDYVAGDEIGRLRTPPHLEDFNLAPKPTRQQSVVEATVLAHEVALPFFDRFRRPAHLIDRLLESDLPGFWEALAFDYVLCFGGRHLGLELLARRLSGDNDLTRRFVELLPSFQTAEYRELAARQCAQGLPLGGHQERAGRLATIAAAYGLDASSPV